MSKKQKRVKIFRPEQPPMIGKEDKVLNCFYYIIYALMPVFLILMLIDEINQIK